MPLYGERFRGSSNEVSESCGYALYITTLGVYWSHMEITDYNEDGEPVYHSIEIAHYHGDYVRILFVTAAILMLIMQFTGNGVFASPAILIVFVAILAIAAGITSPVQRTIHWINLLIAFTGLAIFGTIAAQRLNSIRGFFTHDGITGIIAIIFLAALYLATRTVRGNATGANRILEAQK